ncbi:UNVERIFIED_CONTAM: hypothetical protein Sangu_2535100 [Sesamum angustifolium]|uniref:Uncharacterized protein n=1 Tax=Sesamum angustifolium TaxID=2727405 RepID=A0AAW2J9T2_9LAMI
MEDAQAVKKENRGETRKDTKEEAPTKKPRTDPRDRKHPFPRVNTMYTPIIVPITQALMVDVLRNMDYGSMLGPKRKQILKEGLVKKGLALRRPS